MKNYNLYFLFLLCFCNACSSKPIIIGEFSNDSIEIFPNYKEVTIPPNIAPLNFLVSPTLLGDDFELRAQFRSKTNYFEVKGQKGEFIIPERKWRKIIQSAMGDKLEITICRKENDQWISFSPFSIYVAPERIDPYMAYRLIMPGYELWNKMGIYQRELESYNECTILENSQTQNNCMNCHSFCMQNPEKMLLHLRDKLPGTILVNNGKLERLDTQTPQTLSSLVYPSWHPSGKYVAFSVNNTKQAFHVNDRNRIEVYDEASDVVIYDVDKHEIVTCFELSSTNSFETFPTFSPDGRMLYFCSALSQKMPDEYSEVKYSLCSISFDSHRRSFGNVVDTLYNSSTAGKSASFPRVSPDGRHLMFTLSSYGNFSIWHKDADLYLIDLENNSYRDLAEVNSNDVESYHSWSSNSRWFTFSSRRLDGLYTHPYIAYIGKDGTVGKPFVLPQKNPRFYNEFMASFNIPEFITGKVKQSGRSIALKAKEESLKVRFSNE
ncbi:MAG: hypothetical protein ACRC3Z_08590 [Phocaeicola sp.]